MIRPDACHYAVDVGVVLADAAMAICNNREFFFATSGRVARERHPEGSKHHVPLLHLPGEYLENAGNSTDS